MECTRTIDRRNSDVGTTSLNGDCQCYLRGLLEETNVSISIRESVFGLGVVGEVVAFGGKNPGLGLMEGMSRIFGTAFFPMTTHFSQARRTGMRPDDGVTRVREQKRAGGCGCNCQPKLVGPTTGSRLRSISTALLVVKSTEGQHAAPKKPTVD